MRSLYYIPDAQRETYQLQVGGALSTGKHHTLSIREYGNPQGIPGVVFHGGPGAGCRDYHAGYFDPKKYRIILIDQRGAGQSTPKGCMEENNTQAIIQDMEAVRKFLSIKKWVIVGGSWGSTLALLYAETHPNSVHALVLRGVFLAREKDTYGFLRDNCTAALMNSVLWQRFKDKVAELLRQSSLEIDNPESADYYIRALYALLTQQPDQQIKAQAAGALSNWEENNATLEVTDKSLEWSASPDGTNMGGTEATFMFRRWFISENQILNNIAVIHKANIPVHIVQGNHDRICLPENADALEEALLPQQVTRYRTNAGHSGGEPENITAIVTATDKLAVQLIPKEVVKARKTLVKRSTVLTTVLTAGLVLFKIYSSSSSTHTPASSTPTLTG